MEIEEAFNKVSNLPTHALVKLGSSINHETLTLALAGTADEERERFKPMLPERAWLRVLDDIEGMGHPRVKDIDVAQQEIVNLLHQLIEDGDISLNGKPDPDYPADEFAWLLRANDNDDQDAATDSTANDEAGDTPETVNDDPGSLLDGDGLTHPISGAEVERPIDDGFSENDLMQNQQEPDEERSQPINTVDELNAEWDMENTVPDDTSTEVNDENRAEIIESIRQVLIEEGKIAAQEQTSYQQVSPANEVDPATEGQDLSLEREWDRTQQEIDAEDYEQTGPLKRWTASNAIKLVHPVSEEPFNAVGDLLHLDAEAIWKIRRYSETSEENLITVISGAAPELITRLLEYLSDTSCADLFQTAQSREQPSPTVTMQAQHELFNNMNALVKSGDLVKRET